MATFGLDSAFIKRFKKELDVKAVRTNQFQDFFMLPQLDIIYNHAGDQLKEGVARKLATSSYGPRPAIEMEIPKSARLATKSLSAIGPSYFRPGSVLLPEDRVLYHFFGQEAAAKYEKFIDRSKVFSNKPLTKKGAGFAAPSLQWSSLKTSFEEKNKSSKYTIVLKCDIAQYFFSINQHEAINQLEHYGLEPELVRLGERFLAGLTMDRSSRGIVQGCYGSDVIGNGYLSAIDEYIEDAGFIHFRYVDDMYILFENSESMREFFPGFVKRLREYDLALNESKTFISLPSKLLREETELDKAIAKAKKEAVENLTTYEEIEVDSGAYDGESYIEILEMAPDESEVELHATIEIFDKLDDFKGEERDRAEAFCLSIFRRASDPRAIPYVIARWSRHQDKARDFALYLNRFVTDEKHRSLIDKALLDASSQMIDFQWAWAAMLMRRMKKMSPELLGVAQNIQKDGSRHEVIRSLLTYTVCRHGTAPAKKVVRDAYPSSPLLVQLAILHSSEFFTAGERAALLKTAEAHGDLQALLCQALKAQKAASAAKS